MEGRKHMINCDMTHDHQSGKLLIINEDSTGVGRAYECTFCKRGFTSAQALGGHMNIHRKNKAKVKKRNGEEPSNQSIKPVGKYFNSRCFSNVSSSEGHHVSYLVYLPSSNPSNLTQNCQSIWMPEEQFMDYMKANVNMRIGLHPIVDEEEACRDSRILQENEVDLELRLGHGP